MQSFSVLVKEFGEKFHTTHFDTSPASLYQPCEYFLSIGGKRIRPILCLMGNELFSDIHPDAYQVANAIEIFHNFTLIHDDIIDAASLRRGMETVHIKYGTNTALLAGDVMLIKAYEYLNKIHPNYAQKIMNVFNQTAKEVCEGQQLDIDFENQSGVTLDAYLHMITLKTSVLLAASLELGAIIGGASLGNCKQLYSFGKNLGIAFQIQDDYLDAFGDPDKFGKEVGGDIKQNKKTFLMIHALEVASSEQKQRIQQLVLENPANKVAEMLAIYKACGVDEWAKELKEKYYQAAIQNLEDIAVRNIRKKPLVELASFLIQREH